MIEPSDGSNVFSVMQSSLDSKQNIHIVWFKRDLRIRDHEPLSNALKVAASAGDAVLLLHVFDPKDLQHSTTSNRHLQFRWQAWCSLEQEIQELTLSHIIMATLWILIVKCKLRKSLKK